jgi:BirA family biotin operon repressor/biotin-[acetyl-CoA-carboxylase] ligase
MGVPSRAFSRTSLDAQKTHAATAFSGAAWDIVTSRTHLPAVDSTNSAIARRFESDPHLPSWTLLTADHQTRGRGRYGRTWVDASNALLASLFVRLADEKLDWVTALAGLAVIRTLDDIYGESLGSIGIKWPNDVIVDGRKVAGILTEHLGTCSSHSGVSADRAGAFADREDSHALVIGIGMNFAPTDSAAGPNAGYVPMNATHEDVLAGIITHLRDLLDGDSKAWRRAYSDRLIGKGRATTIVHADGTRTEAVIVEVDDHAGLVVSVAEDPGHSLQTITCGDVALPTSHKEAR